jgi:hypothetical protein
LILLTLSCSLQAQTKSSAEVSESAREFVQQFYSWYLPQAGAGERWDFVLKDRSSVFTPELARALREDSVAQAKVQGEIVGLDFDPFLASQDPCERYEAGSAVAKRASYWVSVYGVCSGKRHDKADVVAEVIRKDDRWVFVNFHYSKDGNLLAVLKTLREDRGKSAK